MYANKEGMSRGAELQHTFLTLARHWWVLLAALLLGCFIALIVILKTEPVYRATTSLLIEAKQTNVVSIDELIGVDSEAPDYYKTQFAMLRSRGLAHQTIDALDLWKNPELSSGSDEKSGSFVSKVRQSLPWLSGPDEQPVPAADTAAEGEEDFFEEVETESAAVKEGKAVARDQRQRERVVSEFLERLSIAPIAETKLVRIHYQSKDPELAATVANAVAEQYITSYLDSRLARTERAAKWLGSRVDELQTTLEESEQRLIDFKRENGLIDIGGNVSRLGEQELLLATQELATAQREVAQQRELQRKISAAGGDSSALLAIGRIQQDSLVQRARIEEITARQEVEELGTRYGPKHPNVIEARSRLDTVLVGLDQQIDRVVGVIRSEYEASLQRLTDIRSQLQSGKAEVQALGEQRLRLDALEREVATNLNIYQTFYNRMTESRSADGLDVANASIADRAIAPERPISPKPMLALASAALLSLLLASAAVIAREQLDRNINESSDIEQFGYSVLGALPRVGGRIMRRFSKKGPLDPDDVDNGMFVEAVNAVRTTLHVTDRSDNRQVILVTSSVPGEGKSSVSMNLAHSFGRVGKVLLIDADLRQPAVTSSRRNAQLSPGLSGVIGAGANLRASILKDELGKGIDVLPAGKRPRHPLELLSSDRVDTLMTLLRKHYDRIIIDSPPIRAVSDAQVLAKLSDTVVYVVRAHSTDSNVVQRGLNRLELAGSDVDIAGVVLTQVDPAKARAYQGEKFYSAYHDMSKLDSRTMPDVRLPQTSFRKRPSRAEREAAKEAAASERTNESAVQLSPEQRARIAKRKLDKIAERKAARESAEEAVEGAAQWHASEGSRKRVDASSDTPRGNGFDEPASRPAPRREQFESSGGARQNGRSARVGMSSSRFASDDLSAAEDEFHGHGTADNEVKKFEY